MRRDCQLVKLLKSIPGIEKVTITTNGVLLDRYLEPLLEAGIDRINISLDTLDPCMYEKITGFDRLACVMKTIGGPGIPVRVKINAVSIDFSSMDGEGCSGPGQLVEGAGGTDRPLSGGCAFH